MGKHFWNGFYEGLVFSLPFVFVGTVILIALLVKQYNEPQYHITCYSPDLAITYMSIEPVTLPNEYGVWKFASGKGVYIQQYGDTCVTQDVVEMPTQSIPE